MSIHKTPIIRTSARWLAIIFLKFAGWKVQGARPDIPKYVMIAAPHTSNWDFIYALAISLVYRIDVLIMMKAAWFFWPLGPVFRWLGAMPIDRSRSHNVVAQMIAAFEGRAEMILMVPPAGTRKKVRYWKTGFYHIANGAGVPIAMGYLDYRLKTGGIGPVFHPTGDIDQDLKAIHKFYRNITGRHPHQSIQVPAVSGRYEDRPVSS
ncbi:MAG: lysophospholipid acyltransferase family protein [Thermodesulfobacteriota bacterium]